MNFTTELRLVKQASRSMVSLSEEKVNQILRDLSKTILHESDRILEASKQDCEKIDPDDPSYDRLLLSKESLQSIAQDVETIASLPSPLHRTIKNRTVESGLHLSKVTVPLGVIGIIYEARPNVTIDAFSLCFKSGNACVLKGGNEAYHSNRTLVDIIHKILIMHDTDPQVIFLLPQDRSAVDALLSAQTLVDVIIPRGGRGLIEYVREHARVPIIETGAGIVHTYVDKSADMTSAPKIIENAKTRRPSVCNALDTLIVHEQILSQLPSLVAPLASYGVDMFADIQSYQVIKETYPKEVLHHATEEHFGTEFLSLKLSIKTVKNVQEAIVHIMTHSSKHSEAILAQDQETIRLFLRDVDAAVVYVNTSTAFTDGAQFGMGGEVGISTQKLHVRGPIALSELVSYKWIVRGEGQIRLP